MVAKRATHSRTRPIDRFSSTDDRGESCRGSELGHGEHGRRRSRWELRRGRFHGGVRRIRHSPVAGELGQRERSIDFEKEKLLVFAWAGSGRDKVSVTDETKDGKTLLKINYTPGLTRDLRQHAKLFVVPKGAEMAK